jgi:hypothetical protein
MHKGSQSGAELGMPHNGLANSTPPLPLARNQSDTTFQSIPSWAEIASSAPGNAPKCAPLNTSHVPPGRNDELLDSDRSQRCTMGDPSGQVTTSQALAKGSVGGVAVNRSPKDLRLHPSIARLGLLPSATDLNDMVQDDETKLYEAVSITTCGIILSGFSTWHLAVLRKVEQIPCLLYSWSQDKALEWLLQNNRSRLAWNKYCRIVLAMELEPNLVAQALANKREGGRQKGLINLSKAEQVHVRSKLAALARVCPVYIDRVKQLRTQADQKVLDALQHGDISINRAWSWRELSFPQQVVALSRFLEDRATNEMLRPLFRKPSKLHAEQLDPTRLLQDLTRLSLIQPGTIRVLSKRISGKVVVVFDQHFDESLFQGDLPLA